MKTLFLFLVLFPMVCMAAISGKAVRTINGRSGVVELTKSDVGITKPVEVAFVEYTFTREYSIGEVIELVDIPANARVFRINISDLFVDPAPSIYADLGTTQTPTAFGASIFNVNGFPFLYVNNKETVDTKLILTVQDDFSGNPTMTDNLTGKTVKVHVEYFIE